MRRDTGEEVVIYPSLHWGHREAAPGPDFQILGGPSNGTYAELVAVPEANVFPKPARLSWEEAAAMSLAGLTAYRALFARGGLVTGETVLVLGAGSGVSTFVVQLAAQAGARVLVTSSSDEKIERSRALGAEGGVNYATGDWVAEVKELGGADLVVDSVGSTWPQSLECLRPGGRLVVFGATGRHRGDAVGAPALLRPAVAARHADGQPVGLRRLPQRDRARLVAAGDRLRPSARRRCERRLASDGGRGALRQAGAHMQLSVTEWGDPAGEPVVCLHGVTGHGRRFRRLAEERLAAYRVIGVDYRGHGRSGWEPPWSVEQHVADLVETADALGISGGAWIGHSFGGKLVAELAARYPDRVERAVLLDPAMHIEPDVAGERADGARADVSFASADEAIDARLARRLALLDPARDRSRRRRASTSSRGPTAAFAGSGRRPP